MDHPDVYQLAILAEQANVDLRILVLQVCSQHEYLPVKVVVS